MPTRKDLEEARRRRREEHQRRNREAAEAEAAALRESQDQRTNRLRMARMRRSRAHKERSARAAAAEGVELQHIRAKRAAEEMSGGGITVRAGKSFNPTANKATQPPEDKGGGRDELAGVQFASPQAEQLARELNLGARDFQGHAPSSEFGYTKRDVEEVSRRPEQP